MTSFRTVLTRPHQTPLYPWLVGALPIVHFYGRNFRLLKMRDNLPMLFIYGLVIAVVLAAGTLIWKSLSRSALVLTPLLAVVVEGGAMGMGVSLGLLGLTILLGLLLAPRRGRLPWSDLPRVNLPLNTALLLLVLMPLIGVVQAMNRGNPPVPSSLFHEPLAVPDKEQVGYKPDVYYFLVDALGQPEFLEQVYHLPRAAFSDVLAERGFHVLRYTFANYPQTALSASATLNVGFLPDLLDIPDSNSQDRHVLAHLVGEARVTEAFRSLGYHVVSYPSGYPLTRIGPSEYRHRPFLHPSFTDYYVLNDSFLTLLMPLLDRGPAAFSYALRRRRLHYILDHLTDARRKIPADEPVFVYTHLLAPHPPFVFGVQGESVELKKKFAFADGNHWYNIHGRHKGLYRSRYSNQALYIMDQLGKMVDRILADSPRPPVIIIQGDHGPGSELEWEHPQLTNYDERMGIFNAWWVPRGVEPELYEGMTAVNTFPLLFNALFKTEWPLLPDNYWFATMSRPYTYYDLVGHEPGP